MQIFPVVLFVLSAAFIIYFYNVLVKNVQMVAEALSGIDVQLKRRADLIPRLVETVKGYAAHESTVFEAITALRSKAKSYDIEDLKKREAAEKDLSGALSKLLVVVENYPDLKANKNFLELQEALVAVEDEIQMARRYYNGAVRNLNIAVQSFPSNVVARIMNFHAAEFFELESLAERAVPQV